jgi:hypothetical protein
MAVSVTRSSNCSLARYVCHYKYGCVCEGGGSTCHMWVSRGQLSTNARRGDDQNQAISVTRSSSCSLARYVCICFVQGGGNM